MKIKRASILFGWALGLLAPSAFALSFDGSVGQTMGTQQYQGTHAMVKLFQSGISLTPSYSGYHSGISTGTFHTFSGRLGYDTGLFGVGATAGFTPRNNGYSNQFFGLDAVISVTPTGGGAPSRIRGSQRGKSGASGKGLARVDVGGGVTYISHRDNQGLTAARVSPLNIGQTNLNASVGVSFLDILLSADVTKSVYDHKLGSVGARPAQVQNLTGVDATTQGFPNTSTSIRAELPLLPLVTPYGVYTHTTFQGTPRTDAYTVGGYVDLDMLMVTASYIRYVQVSGLPALNYFSLGAGLRF